MFCFSCYVSDTQEQFFLIFINTSWISCLVSINLDTINRKRKGNSYRKWRDLRMEVTHKHTETEWYILAITDAFLDLKRVNVCGHTVITTCSHTFTLLIEKEICDHRNISSFHVCVFFFHPEIASFFGKSFPFFPQFIVLLV